MQDSPPADPAVLFDGSDLYVRADLTLPGEAVIVTFSPRRDFATRKGPRSSGFGESLFQREGIPHVCFISKANHWWHTAELQAAMDLVRPLVQRFSRVVTYGVSMGAHGALIAARDLGATHVLAFAPQADVSGALPLHPLWQTDLRDVAMCHDLATRLPRPDTRITLVVDPTVAVDRAHRRAIEALMPAESLLTPLSGHSSSLFLADLGLLKPIVLDALAGCFDILATRRHIRGARMRHPLYAIKLAAWHAKRGRAGQARACRTHAIECLLAGARWDPPKAHLAIQNHLRELAEAGKDRDVRKLIARLLEDPVHAYSGHLAKAGRLLAVAQARPAIRHAKAAIALGSRQAQPFLLLVQALLVLDATEAAEAQLANAIARRGALPQDWIAVSEALKGKGCADAARRAAAAGLSRFPGSVPLERLAQG